MLQQAITGLETVNF